MNSKKGKNIYAHLSLLLVTMLFSSMSTFSQEICNNGIDDDADGLIDLNDTECSCSLVIIQPSSLIPNPSFEQMDCCPNFNSQMTCATGWIQASNGTSDYLNTCGYTNVALLLPPPLPLPSGNGYVGFYDIFSGNNIPWKEYVGACLSSTMLAGQSYTLTLDISVQPTWSTVNPPTALDFTIFGTPNCVDLPWATETCPVGSGSWVALTNQTVAINSSTWQTITLTFTPSVNINAVSLGPACGAFSETYTYVDGLVLNETSLFTANMQETGTLCTNLQLFSLDAPIGTYQWYLNGVALAGETNSTINLNQNTYGPGYYTLKIDSGGTCYTISQNVTLPPMPVAIATATNQCLGTPINFNDASTISSGSITGWQWDAGDGIGFSSAQNPSYIYGSAGSYTATLIVTSDQGCKDTISGNIQVYPTSNTTELATICSGSNYTFPDGTTQTNITAQVVYTSNLFTTNGCDSMVETTVNIAPQSTISSNPIDTVCLGNAIVLTATGSGNGIITWYSDFAGTTSIGIGNPSPPFTPGSEGTIIYYVNEVSACSSSMDSVIVIVQSVTALINANPFSGISPLLVNFGNGSIGATSYLWDFGNANTSTEFAPPQTYIGSGVYQVILIATDGFCWDTTSVIIDVFDESSILIPNVFTPNKDGFNDIFTVAGTNLTSVEGQIFNRWGQKLYEWNSIKGYWDGRTIAGTEVPDGTYFYLVKAEGVDKKKYFKQGSFTLIR